ncbi:MAG: serine/threonine-protein phosphatase [Myxococcales bacterium]|nr:serine/threonine-protein phosphatase [Myxococcales bacterium]
MKLIHAAASHLGRRANQEDSYCARDDLGLFAVADGMGGYEGGEVASDLTISTMCEFYDSTLSDGERTWPVGVDPRRSMAENRLAAAVRLANSKVAARRQGRLANMGSTVAALDLHNGAATVGHVGDSRVYRLRDGALVQLTRDHSLLEALTASGAEVDPANFGYRNIIVRALGFDNALPDVSVDAVRPGDVYLLCTDGLTDPLTDDDIGFLLYTRPPAAAARDLVGLAYELGGRDNITVVVIKVLAA